MEIYKTKTGKVYCKDVIKFFVNNEHGFFYDCKTLFDAIKKFNLSEYPKFGERFESYEEMNGSNILLSNCSHRIVEMIVTDYGLDCIIDFSDLERSKDLFLRNLSEHQYQITNDTGYIYEPSMRMMGDRKDKIIYTDSLITVDLIKLQ